MRQVWIIDAVRTPIGRHGGALASVRPDDLAAVAVHRRGEPHGWYGYVLAAELIWHADESPRIHPMPVFPCQASKLETLLGA
jgi:hypothetical protein